MNRIERLRALEKKFQEEATVARDTFKYGGGEYYDGRRDAFNLAADELATLIAELGQEVGAVEVPHPLGERHAAIEKALKGHTLLLMSRDHVNDQKKPLAEIKFGMSTDLGVLFCLADTEATMPVDTSPAHTSEARDAARYRALKTHFQAKFHRATCDYWVIVGELKTDPRFIGEDGEQLTLDNALDAAIAAMRQEAGDAD